MTEPQAKIRVDKWLWYARFCKSRGLAGEVAGSGAVRVNGDRISKPSHAVRPGDVLTFPKDSHIRVIQIVAIGERRGPAVEAQTLYVDLSPPVPKEKKPYVPNPEAERAGRPNRQERDAMRKFKGE